MTSKRKYKIHEVETNVTYDDIYSTVEEAETIIEQYQKDDGDRDVTYNVIDDDGEVCGRYKK